MCLDLIEFKYLCVSAYGGVLPGEFTWILLRDYQHRLTTKPVYAGTLITGSFPSVRDDVYSSVRSLHTYGLAPHCIMQPSSLYCPEVWHAPFLNCFKWHFLSNCPMKNALCFHFSILSWVQKMLCKISVLFNFSRSVYSFVFSNF